MQPFGGWPARLARLCRALSRRGQVTVNGSGGSVVAQAVVSRRAVGSRRNETRSASAHGCALSTTASLGSVRIELWGSPARNVARSVLDPHGDSAPTTTNTGMGDVGGLESSGTGSRSNRSHTSSHVAETAGPHLGEAAARASSVAFVVVPILSEHHSMRLNSLSHWQARHDPRR